MKLAIRIDGPHAHYLKEVAFGNRGVTTMAITARNDWKDALLYHSQIQADRIAEMLPVTARALSVNACWFPDCVNVQVTTITTRNYGENVTVSADSFQIKHVDIGICSNHYNLLFTKPGEGKTEF